MTVVSLMIVAFIIVAMIVLVLSLMIVVIIVAVIVMAVIIVMLSVMVVMIVAVVIMTVLTVVVVLVIVVVVRRMGSVYLPDRLDARQKEAVHDGACRFKDADNRHRVIAVGVSVTKAMRTHDLVANAHVQLLRHLGAGGHFEGTIPEPAFCRCSA
ncbi:MAG: hypothetical protein AAF752_10095, partial [Bacteroidota bacterium]